MGIGDDGDGLRRNGSPVVCGLQRRPVLATRNGWMDLQPMELIGMVSSLELLLFTQVLCQLEHTITSVNIILLCKVR